MPAPIATSFPGFPAVVPAAPALMQEAGATTGAASSLGGATGFGALVMAHTGVGEILPVQLAVTGAAQDALPPAELPEFIGAEPVKGLNMADPVISGLPVATDALPVESGGVPDSPAKTQTVPATAEQEDLLSLAPPRMPISVQGAPTVAQPLRPDTKAAVDGKPLPDKPTSASKQADASDTAKKNKLTGESQLAQKNGPVDKHEAVDTAPAPQQAIAPQSPLPIPPIAVQTTALSLSQAAAPTQEEAPAAPHKADIAVASVKIGAKATPRATVSVEAREPTTGETAPDAAFMAVHDNSVSLAQPALPDKPDASGGEGSDKGLSSPLLTQTLAPVANKPAGSPYPAAAAQAPVPAPVIQAQPGRMGVDIGVQIAKAAKGEREDLLIRLDPREMGRVDVRLSFDRDGLLRAVLSADSPAALDMLRRESGDLNRALADAGIRADGQSLRFDARPGDQGAGDRHGGHRDQPARDGTPGFHDESMGDLADLPYRPLRTSGHVNLMA